MTQPPGPPYGAPQQGQPGGQPQQWQYPDQPSGPPAWQPQQQWVPAPTPPYGGGKTKWILAGLAVLAVIVLTAIVTVVVVRPGHGSDGSGSPANLGSDLASANDTGPITIITDDPTCGAWNKAVEEYYQVASSVKFDDRDDTVPASSWNPELRNQYETIGKALTHQIDQATKLVSKTPHRAVRVLYQQFIAYAQAFIESIPNYVADDDYLVSVSNSASSSVANVCGAIARKAAQAAAPLEAEVDGPTNTHAPEELATPSRMLEDRNSVCSEWEQLAIKLNSDTEAWRNSDKAIPAKDLTPQQKSMHEALGPVLIASADNLERLGRQSANASLEDLATLAAVYRRGFVAALPTYTVNDSYLELTAASLTRLVNSACKSPS